MRQLCRRLLEAGAGLLFLAAATAQQAHAATPQPTPPMAVRAAVIEPAGAGVRLVVDVTGLLSTDRLSPFFLPGPKPRFVLDLPSATWAAAERPATHGLVAGLRHGAQGNRTRLVLDLTGEGQLLKTTRTNTADGARLVFDLAPLAGGPSLEAPVPVAPPIAPRAPVAPVAEYQKRRLVVLDPGHGGKDTGAPGKDGAMEKDFNLAAALTLRSALEKRGYDVVLTRETDTFLSLADRVKIARDRKADLFLSLHSDADPQGQAKGATVYTLSQRGAARAKGLADDQNWSIDPGQATPAAAKGRVGAILLDLTQRETNDHSWDFAEGLVSRLEGAAPLNAAAPRRAGFFVLLAPDVPAALLEMGFVTHRDDERRLGDARQRKVMMDAVAAAVDDYFAGQAQGKAYASAMP